METPSESNATGEAAEFVSGSDKAKCYVCLSDFEKQAVASLENCQHAFCLECILQWSQTANTCPVDRIGFAFIYQRRCPGGDILKKIKVQPQKKDADNDDDDEEEGVSSAVICEECGRSDRRHLLAVCTLCDSGYHMHCLRPSVNTHPDGDWICPECAAIFQSTDGSMVLEEEISDGELTDLFAEEPASTFGRLRPSTINRPSGTRERRHSQRIQSRASGDPDPPRTCWHVPNYLLRAAKPAAARHPGDTTSTSELKTRKRRKRAA